MTPALFAPGIVSTDGIELNTVFTPDLKEMFFARAIDRVPSMFHSRLVDGAWTTPRELLLFPGEVRALAVDMAVSPDGNELYFLGNYQPPKYFFFSRRQSTGGEATAGDVYWMDAKFLEQFRR